MISTIHTTKSDFGTYLPEKFVFIGYASFEKRSSIIPLTIEKERIIQAYIFRSKGNYDNESVESINGYLNDCIDFIELEISDSINTAREITNTVKKILLDNNISLVIDITTFTHETLLILLKLIMSNKEKFSCVYCLYNGADKYSVNENLDKVWLSKGCKDVRNVIGYPGLIRPVNKNCLIILTGFELERATRLIELIEPDRLLLGNAKDPISPNNAELMQHFKNKFESWKNNYNSINCSSFDFSCKNVENTISVLEEIINTNNEGNNIIVPLNTKLSTIAVGIVAIQNKNIQVCYSIPETYNIRNYSSPSSNITVVSLV